MDLTHIIGIIITSILVPQAMYFLNKQTNKKVDLKNGYYKLYYSKYYLPCSIFFIVVGVGFFIYFNGGWSFNFSSLFFSSICILSIIAGLYISLEILNQKLFYNEEEIIFINWRKERIQLRFTEIESFKKNNMGYLILQTRLDKIRVALLLNGFNQFYDFLVLKVNNDDCIL